MKSWKEMTGRYLKAQKKRSVLAVCGIILSVALFTGIGTILLSIQDLMIQEEIASGGDWEFRVDGLTAEQAGRVADHVMTVDSGMAVEAGHAWVEETDSQVTVFGVNDGWYRHMAITLEEGRLPMKPGEIVLEQAVCGQLTQSDGHARSVRIGDATYAVVGLVESAWTTNLAMDYQAFTWLEEPAADASFTVAGITRGPEDVYGDTRAILNDAGAAEAGVQFNEPLLRLRGASGNPLFNGALLGIVAFITAVVVVCTIAVIYNVFHISVMERITQFGMLRCIGATPGQIRRLVMREALTLGVIGIPVGILCGTGAMAILFRIFGLIDSQLPFGDMRVVVSPWIIGSSLALGFATVVGSAFGPARQAGRISPIEAVRATGQIRNESFRHARRGGWMTGCFGIEAGLAWKNVNRSRKRFVITVFSLVISMSLYIIFTGFARLAFDSGVVGKDLNVSWMLSAEDAAGSEALLAELRQRADVQTVFQERTDSLEAHLDAALIGERFCRTLEELQPSTAESLDAGDGRVKLQAVVMCVGDDAMQALATELREGSMEPDRMNEDGSVVVMPAATLYSEDGRRSAFADSMAVKTGDAFTLLTADGTVPVTVSGVLAEGPVSQARVSNDSVMVLVTESQFAAWADTEQPFAMYVRMKPDADQESMKAWVQRQAGSSDGSLTYVDYREMDAENRKTVLIFSIFLYGFVTVISLIGCLNIVNTISTNLILRTRELSMMRAVGMTRGGMVGMILTESLFHGVAAVFWGAICGTALLRVLFGLAGIVRDMPFAIPWADIGFSAGGTALIVLIASLAPLRRINRGNIMEQIRAEN